MQDMTDLNIDQNEIRLNLHFYYDLQGFTCPGLVQELPPASPFPHPPTMPPSILYYAPAGNN